MGNKNRIIELDALRGVAALLVVLFHYTTKYASIYGIEYTVSVFNFSYGHYGVDLFFIISGFVIFLTLQKCKNGFYFVYNRVARLYPTFWVSLIITFSATTLFAPERLQRTFEEFLVNLSMIPSLMGYRFIDGVYWSLVPEIFFYAFMLLVFLFKKLDKIELIGFFWLLIMLVNSIFIKKFENLDFFTTILNLQYGMLFLIGINFFKIYNKESNWVNHLQIALSVLVAFYVNQKQEYLLILFLLIIVFYLFVYDKLFFIKIKPLLFIGKISYSLYLVHQFIGYIIIQNLIQNHITNYYILIIVPFLISCGIAFLIVRFVEIPSNRFLKNIYKNKIIKVEKSIN